MKAAVKGSQKAKTFPSPNRPQLCRDVSERPPRSSLPPSWQTRVLERRRGEILQDWGELPRHEGWRTGHQETDISCGNCPGDGP